MNKIQAISDTRWKPEVIDAWLAALIDGEGSIMLIDRRRLRANQFRAVVSIANTDPRLAEALIAKTGIGKVYIHKAPGPRNRQQYTWRMNAEELRVWLPRIIPFLVLKQRQAVLLLEYLTIAAANTARKDEPFRPINLHRKSEIHTNIRLLNRRAGE